MSQQLFTQQKIEQHCPQCNALLQIKRGKQGLFLGCSAYPDCDYLKPLKNTMVGQVLKVLPQNCPECGTNLVLRQGQFGMFIGCGNYPECEYIVHDLQSATSEQENITCPSCNKGKLLARRGQRGKTFYGCDHFPQCRFTLDRPPLAKSCPKCHFPIAVLKKKLLSNSFYQCGNKSCRYEFSDE